MRPAFFLVVGVNSEMHVVDLIPLHGCSEPKEDVPFEEVEITDPTLRANRAHVNSPSIVAIDGSVRFLHGWPPADGVGLSPAMLSGAFPSKTTVRAGLLWPPAFSGNLPQPRHAAAAEV